VARGAVADVLGIGVVVGLGDTSIVAACQCQLVTHVNSVDVAREIEDGVAVHETGGASPCSAGRINRGNHRRRANRRQLGNKCEFPLSSAPSR